ncbi:MAG: SpoIIE family protein phosphatase, partial [Eubacteriales bacterium]
TGRCSFVKAGAAPTYILRTGKLYKIFSATPPVGILSSFAAESTRFDVEPNDLILMLSDGVVPNGEDGAWLAELIRMDQTGDPATLAGRILEKAREINTRGDDMSVAVIRVKGQKAA